MQPIVHIDQSSRFFERGIEKIASFKSKNPANEGITRLGYSENENRAFRYVKWLMEQAGLTTVVDSAGNLYGVAKGVSEKALLVGSHLDSVPNGGRYDGIAGVLAGIEVVRSLSMAQKNEFTLVAVAWRCEESSRFGTPYVGSKIAFNKTTGLFELSDRFRRRSREFHNLAEAIRKAGFEPKNGNLMDKFNIAGYFELHAEQGLILEEAETPVGLVTHIAGNRRFDLQFRGKPDHTGGTMMGDRHDAMLGVAEALVIGENLAKEYNEANGNERLANYTDIRFSPSVIEQRGGNRTTIASDLTVQFDVRSIDEHLLESFMREYLWRVKIMAAARKIDAPTMIQVGSEKPIGLDPRMLEIQDAAARALAIPATTLPSGAGHDAKVPFCEGIPVGVFFIPSVDGWSHNPKEFSRTADYQMACQVLAETMVRFEMTLR
jgi:hydantoinase/carbamoylase family amidase